MKKHFLLLIFFCLNLAAFAQNKTFNIIDFGAVSGSKILNTTAIQKAIDACSRNGGGMVYVPAGTFITGTFHLKSNINLFLESGAVLKGSSSLQDYDHFTQPVYGLTYFGIVYTVDAENVSITGQGTIDGNNQVFHDFNHAKKIDSVTTRFSRQKNNYRNVASGIGDGPVVPNKGRPHQMVIFSNCKNVQVRNVSLLNSPFWTMHFADCDNVLVSGIRLWSGLLVPNADGIDITSSSNVIITDCDIRSGDDALAIVGYDHHFEIPGFSGKKHVSENIIVSNCNLQSYSSGIRIGFLDQNTVRNVQVSNVNITNSTRGIGIFLRDEGSLENLTFSNINIETKLRTGDWWGNGEPIHISAIRGKENVKLGHIKNVKFNHINCISENGMLVYGTDESVIEDVSFNDINFELTDSKLNDVAGGNIDLRGVLGEKNQIFKHDIPGLLIENAKNISINDFKLSWTDPRLPFYTHGIEAHNFENLQIEHFTGGPSPANKQAARIFLGKGTGFTTDNLKGVVKQK
ncbi:MAG: glycoside hydrolase family 28 protein [Janthinobacterium lividum]